MLVKIVKVATANGNDQRTYARDILGRAFFPQTNDMELKVGDWAYATKTMQTKTRDEAGELVDLAQPVERLIITATFPTKVAAVQAAAEVGTVEMEVAAEVAKTAKELGLSDEAVKLLANAIP